MLDIFAYHMVRNGRKMPVTCQYSIIWQHLTTHNFLLQQNTAKCITGQRNTHKCTFLSDYFVPRAPFFYCLVCYCCDRSKLLLPCHVLPTNSAFKHIILLLQQIPASYFINLLVFRTAHRASATSHYEYRYQSPLI